MLAGLAGGDDDMMLDINEFEDQKKNGFRRLKFWKKGKKRSRVAPEPAGPKKGKAGGVASAVRTMARTLGPVTVAAPAAVVGADAIDPDAFGDAAEALGESAERSVETIGKAAEEAGAAIADGMEQAAEAVGDGAVEGATALGNAVIDVGEEVVSA